MKHDVLRSIAHNLTDSIASGCGLLIGVYDMNVFGEARRSENGILEIDFLNGTVTRGEASPSLAKAIGLYRDALPDLCARHGASVESFRHFTAQFSDGAGGGVVHVTVEDQNGRGTTDEYAGTPLRRTTVLDRGGRVRAKPGRSR